MKKLTRDKGADNMEPHYYFEVSAVDNVAKDAVEIALYCLDRNDNYYLAEKRKFRTGREALLEMLYGDIGFVTDEWRNSTLHMMEEIFPETSDLEVAQNYEKDLTPWKRFCLEQMTLGKQIQPIEYRAGIRQDRSELATLFSKAFEKATNETVSMRTYQEMCETVIKYNLDVPDKEYMVFQDSDSVCNWLLMQTIKTSRSIRRCPICKKFFFARNNQTTCSSACKNIKNSLILFGNSIELAKKHNRLNAKFYSKIESVQVFKFPDLPDTEQAAELEALCCSAGVQLNGLLWSEQFKKLCMAFHTEVKDRCNHLKEVKAAVLRGEIPAAEESNAVEEFEDWITKLDEQMRLFSYSRKNMTPTEEDEADMLTDQLRERRKK